MFMELVNIVKLIGLLSQELGRVIFLERVIDLDTLIIALLKHGIKVVLQTVLLVDLDLGINTHSVIKALTLIIAVIQIIGNRYKHQQLAVLIHALVMELVLQ